MKGSTNWFGGEKGEHSRAVGWVGNAQGSWRGQVDELRVCCGTLLLDITVERSVGDKRGRLSVPRM